MYLDLCFLSGTVMVWPGSEGVNRHAVSPCCWQLVPLYQAIRVLSLPLMTPVFISTQSIDKTRGIRQPCVPSSSQSDNGRLRALIGTIGTFTCMT